MFLVFYYIWAWWPYWSCDLDGLNMSDKQEKQRMLLTLSAISFSGSFHQLPRVLANVNAMKNCIC